MCGRRFAYAAFVVVGLLYFPARVGFHLSPRVCQVALDVPLALHSLTNYPHIILRSQSHNNLRRTLERP